VLNQLGQRSETFLAGLIEDLEAIGWQAWVASLRPPVNREEFPFPPTERFVQPRRPAIWKSALGRMLGRSARIRGTKWWRPVIEDVQPDVIHVHFGWAAAPAAFEHLGKPTVISFHGSDVRSWPHRFTAAREAYNELFGTLRYATAGSKSIAEEVIALGFRGRMEVIHPGVHLDEFQFRLPSERSEGTRLLFVGRQVECKGLDVLIEAFPRVVRWFPEASLVAIGDGPDAAANAARVRGLGLEHNVKFLGAQPHQVVARELARAQALVVPSRTSASGEAEGGSVAAKEAMASGVPVIATSCGGLPEVIPPAQRQALVAEADPDALAAAILTFLEHPETWPELALAGHAWARTQFDARQVATRIAALYEEIARR
jgi:colanic acid/amylovoran biosynthesis glycosyltransferase